MAALLAFPTLNFLAKNARIDEVTNNLNGWCIKEKAREQDQLDIAVSNFSNMVVQPSLKTTTYKEPGNSGILNTN